MKLNVLLLIPLLFPFSKVEAQNYLENYKLGHYVDLNGQLIDGYYDLDYEPIEPIKVHHSVRGDFTPGYYYNTQNEKVSGYLKLSENNKVLKFKDSYYSSDRGVKIKPESCTSFVIGKDSFVMLQNTQFKNVQFQSGFLGAVEEKGNAYLEVLERVGDFAFFKFERLIQRTGHVDTDYFVRKKEGSVYTRFPNGKKKFKEMAVEVFGEMDVLRRGIEAEKYTNEDMPALIKMFKFYKKYNRKEKIYYNTFWDEVEDKEQSIYYGVIESIEDSLFYMKYHFSDGTPIYEGGFISFYPHKKVGTFTWYYPSGEKRKLVTYWKNKPKQIETFYKTGVLHRKYVFVEKVPAFLKVNDENGKALMDNTGKASEVFNDPITGNVINYEYENRQLVKAFYTNSNQQNIYQKSSKNAKGTGLNELMLKLKGKIKNYQVVIRENAHGVTLVKCIIESNGEMSDVKILKSVNGHCDSVVVQLLQTIVSGQPLVRWKPGKDGKEKITQEIILPVDYLVRGFSPYRNHYYFYWHNDFHMYHMMSTPVFVPPSPPSW